MGQLPLLLWLLDLIKTRHGFTVENDFSEVQVKQHITTKANFQMQCNHIIYHKSSRNVSMSKKEEIEDIAFDIEPEKRSIRHNDDDDDDWKRLEKWQVGHARFP